MPEAKGQGPAPHFSEAEREDFYRLLAARRDTRHFRPEATVAPEVLARLLGAFHRAPSVGLMQPGRLLRIVNPDLRAGIAGLVQQERQQTAEALGSRGAEFLQLKVEGVKECAELLVVALAPDDGTVFGRRTMPREMALCSVACAIQNLWLAATAEGLGLGWVSMFDPAALAALLRLPEGAHPIAVLCLGVVQTWYDAPMLEVEQWRQGKALGALWSKDGWGDA